MKKIIVHILDLLGYQIKRLKHIKNNEYQIYTILKNEDPDVILDVGANRGQFAMDLIRNGWNSDIISFEPMSVEHSVLRKRAERYENWRVWDRCAVGEKSDSLEIKIANNSVSSSLLSTTEKHLNAEPSSRSEKTEKVPVINLSSVLKCLNYESIAIKIDVQGYEKAVLLGLMDRWDRITMLIVELSQVELYLGQWLEENVIEFLDSKGFELITRIPGFIDPISGMTLQYDGVFKRR
ncbi:FkbM family methyltransferase [Akkermansiaceae bacterium]|nr:FkbM family methyltransferase [Akkermansiaceae bacterium]